MSVKFEAVTDIDPNVWYHLSEFRVDTYDSDSWSSNFQINMEGNLQVFSMQTKQMWQFHHVDRSRHPGRYSLRHSFFGVYKQLAVCYEPSEASVGKTKPCLLDSVPGEEAQMWDVADWGDGMVRFINVRNGTGYWLDVHKGNPPFMSSNTDTKADNPAQRWLYTSVSDVNDAAFSTVFSAEGVIPSTPQATAISSLTSSPPPEGTSGSDASNDSSSSSSDSSGLSPAVTAGIGAAVGLAVVAIALLVFWLFRRRQKDSQSVDSSSGAFQSTMIVENKAPPSAWTQETPLPPPSQQQQQHQNTYFQQQGAYDPQRGPQQLPATERAHEMAGHEPAEMSSVRY